MQVSKDKYFKHTTENWYNRHVESMRMKPGFDVCLHNKRLDNQMNPSTQKGVEKVETEQPTSRSYMRSVMTGCSRLYKSQNQISGTAWLAYMLVVTTLIHIGLLMWHLPPIGMGSAIRNSTVIVIPCILAVEVNILTRVHVMIAHTAGVYALIFHPSQDETMSTSFYVAAFVIVLTLALCKHHASDQSDSKIRFGIRDFIHVLSIMAVVLLIILKTGQLISEIAVDFCLLVTVALVYTSSYTPL